jgi:hypothetical protein
MENGIKNGTTNIHVKINCLKKIPQRRYPMGVFFIFILVVLEDTTSVGKEKVCGISRNA